MADMIIHNFLLYSFFFLCEIKLATAQFFNPSVDPGTAYYTTYMLCTQTPVEYRTSSCRRNTDCPVPNLTTCLGGICCAKDQISLQALSVYKLMTKDNTGSDVRKGQSQNNNSNRINNNINQNGGNRNPGLNSVHPSQLPSQEPNRQQQSTAKAQIPTIQFREPPQSTHMNQITRETQGSFLQRFAKSSEPMSKPSDRVPTINLIQEKQPRIIIQDKVGMSMSLSSQSFSNSKEGAGGKSVLSVPQGSLLNSPSSGAKSQSMSQTSQSSVSKFVTELTAEQAAKRRAHMQNANNPQQLGRQIGPNNVLSNPHTTQIAPRNSLSNQQQTKQITSSNTFSNQQTNQIAPGNALQNGVGQTVTSGISSTQNFNQFATSNSASTQNNANSIGRQSRSGAPKTESTPINNQMKASASSSKPMECDDIAVIGAGISGTYTAWRLRQSKLKVSVYEATDRIGGRILTYRFREAPDINVELGAMTFLPDKHKRVSKAINLLRLPVVDFENGWNDEDSTLYYLREVHLTYNDLGDMNTPYNLREHELKTPDMLRRYLSSTYTNFSGSMDNIEKELFSTITNDGIPLYHQSYSEAFAKMGSGEASMYLRDQSGFHCTGGATSAALGVPVENPILNITGKPRIQTVAGGMDMIPKSFMKMFLSSSSGNKFNPNNKLVRITREKGNTYNLHFSKTNTINGKTKDIENAALTTCAKSVILTLSRKHLKDIDWKTFKEENINSALDSVIDCPVCKLYLVYDYPWWKKSLKNFTQTKTDLPLRRTFDYGISASTGKAVLLVSFSDGNDVNYWRQLQSHGRRIGWRYDANAVTEHVVNHAHIHLSYVYNTSMNVIPAPRDGSMMVWDDGWSTWKPGVIWPEVRKKLLRPTPHENIFIVPEYYKTHNHQMWSLEGAFESADAVLNHFGLPMFA